MRLFSAAVVVCWSISPAGAEWRVDKITERLADRVGAIARADATEPAGGVRARLQVECLHDRLVGGRLVWCCLNR